MRPQSGQRLFQFFQSRLKFHFPLSGWDCHFSSTGSSFRIARRAAGFNQLFKKFNFRVHKVEIIHKTKQVNSKVDKISFVYKV